MSKQAFLVGINKYKNPIHNLRGCVGDVNHVQNMLKMFGYEIGICLNENATKEGILSGLKRLTSDPKEERKLAFYYSGHGSQIVRRGKEVDEIDNVFEVLCPFDIDFAKENYIMDRELINIFNQLPKETHLDVILDCCYSGSAARDIDDDNLESTYIQGRCISPEIDFEDLVQPTLNKMLDMRNTKVPIKANINYVVWSACKEGQKSTEKFIDGFGIRGIFTYCFCDEIAKHPEISRKTLDDRLTKLVENIVKYQTPLMQYSDDFQLNEKVLE